ncbi:MAG: von Willebrand factor type A domain-containing protein [Planctomycetota bacterium]
MNDESKPTIDPELEVRIVAMVLGEASDFEAEQLRRLIDQRPELAAFENEMLAVDGLVRVATESESIDGGDWKLPEERRSTVVAAIDGSEAGGSVGTVQPAKRESETSDRRSRFRTKRFLGLAAALACSLLVAIGFLLRPVSKSRVAWNKTSGEKTMFWEEMDDEMPSDAKESAPANMPASGYSGGFESSFESSPVPPKKEPSAITRRRSGQVALRAIVPPENASTTETESLDGLVDSSNAALAEIRDNLATNAAPSKASPRALEYFSDSYGRADKKSNSRSIAPPPSPGLYAIGDVPAFIPAESARMGARGAVIDRDGIAMEGANRPEPLLPNLSGIEDRFSRTSDLFGKVPAPATSALARSAPRSAGTRREPFGESLEESVDAPRAGLALGLPPESAELPASPPDKNLFMNLDVPAYLDDTLAQSEQLQRGRRGGGGQGASRFDGGGMIESSRGQPSGQSALPGFAGQPNWAREAQGRTPDQKKSREMLGAMVAPKPAPPAFDDPFGSSPNTDPFGALEDTGGGEDHPVSPPAYANSAGDLIQKDDVAGKDEEADLGELKILKSEVFYNKRIQPSRTDVETKSKSMMEMDDDEFAIGAKAIGGQATFGQPIVGQAKSELRRGFGRTLERRFQQDLKSLGEKNAAEESFSTFSLHVSDVSFKLARTALANGQWPETEKVRIEEFVNAFDYGDPMPSRDEKVACRLEQAAHPFFQQRNVLRVAMRTAAAGRSGSTPLRLTLLLDNSGSMERIDRRQTVRRAFALLAAQLQPFDQVTLISFARTPRLLAEGLNGTQAEQLVSLVDGLPSEGGTNLEAALQLAFEKAKEQEVEGAQNRIILLTDGAVNLGNANPESLSQRVIKMRGAGIAFDAAGISANGLNDEVLEALTRKGDGRYYLLDSIDDCDVGFARQIAGALRPAAKNVKIQVEFNPRRVGSYKLLGFEKHRLKKEDFRNDTVDAAEMAAEEAGVAMYQFEAKPDGEGDIGSVSVRFRDLSTGQMIEKRWPIPYEADAPALELAPAPLRIATSAAMLAAKLRGEPLGGLVDLKTLSGFLASIPPSNRSQRVIELQDMIRQARQLTGN